MGVSLSRIVRKLKRCKNWCAPTRIVFEHPAPEFGESQVFLGFLAIQSRYPTLQVSRRASLPPGRPVFQILRSGSVHVRSARGALPRFDLHGEVPSSTLRGGYSRRKMKSSRRNPSAHHSSNDCAADRQLIRPSDPIDPIVHFGVAGPAPRNVLFSFVKVRLISGRAR